MNRLFRPFRKKCNDNVPKLIPSYYYSSFFNQSIPTMSRFSPTFEQMLIHQLTKQSFMRFLSKQKLDSLFCCYLDFLEVHKTNANYITGEQSCRFTDLIMEQSALKLVSLKDRLKKLITVDIIPKEDMELIICKFDDALIKLVKNKDLSGKQSCAYINLYLKYFSKTAFAAMELSEKNIIQIIVELFECFHGNFKLDSTTTFGQVLLSIEEELSTKLYQQYLKSESHRNYQLELLYSGLHLLKLSDFLYCEQLLLYLTEFLECHELDHYLLFLLSVNALVGSRNYLDNQETSGLSSSLNSFSDYLSVYNKYLIPESDHFLHIPQQLCNTVINKLCTNHSTASSIDNSNKITGSFSNWGGSGDCAINTNHVFIDVYRPVYYFLEEQWLPMFLISDIIRQCMNNLATSRNLAVKEAVKSQQYSLQTTASDVACQYSSPFNILSSEDSSDTTSDHTDGCSITMSVESEPVTKPHDISDNFVFFDRCSGENKSSPSRRLGSGHQASMSLGCIDDLGKYRSNVGGSGATPVPDRNIESNSNKQTLPPDEVARQIIQEVVCMGLHNRK